MGSLLASLLSLSGSCFCGSTCPDTFSPHLLARTRSRINLFRLNERTDRGPAISSVCHRRSLGLLNPYLSVFRVPMMPSVLPRSLRTVSRTASATCHGRLPLGWMPISLTPSWASARQGRRGIAAPVVDHQRRRGLRTKDRAIPRQRLQGHLRFVHACHGSTSQTHTHRRGDSADTAGQTRSFSPPCGARSPGPAAYPHAQFCLGHHPGGDPLHNLRDEALGHLVHGQSVAGTLGHPVATLPKPLDQRRVCTINWPTSVSRRVNTWRLSCLPLANRWCSLTDLRIVCTCARAHRLPTRPAF